MRKFLVKMLMADIVAEVQYLIMQEQNLRKEIAHLKYANRLNEDAIKSLHLSLGKLEKTKAGSKNQTLETMLVARDSKGRFIKKDKTCSI